MRTAYVGVAFLMIIFAAAAWLRFAAPQDIYKAYLDLYAWMPTTVYNWILIAIALVVLFSVMYLYGRRSKRA